MSGSGAAELSRERVAHRVSKGGHDVPPEKLLPRWTASIENLPWFVAHASRFWILDNSDSTPGNPPILIAEGGSGKMEFRNKEAIPEIFRSLGGASSSSRIGE